MKVICIDASVKPGSGFKTRPRISEGNSYTVEGKWPMCRDDETGKILQVPVYTLIEIGGNWGYELYRFIPLSSIDETQFERNLNKELA